MIVSGSDHIRFGIDSDGNYGYKKVGADTVTPFKNPAGSKTITTNGTYDVTDYASAIVNIGSNPGDLTKIYTGSPSTTSYTQSVTSGAYYLIASCCNSSTTGTNLNYVSSGATTLFNYCNHSWGWENIGNFWCANVLIVKATSSSLTITNSVSGKIINLGIFKFN